MGEMDGGAWEVGMSGSRRAIICGAGEAGQGVGEEKHRAPASERGRQRGHDWEARVRVAEGKRTNDIRGQG